MDVLEKSIIGLNFEISVTPRVIVGVKETMDKYSKETGLKIFQEKFNSADGELKSKIGLKGFMKPTEVEERLGIFIGLLKELHDKFAGGISEELAQRLNTTYMVVAEGKEISSLELDGINEKVVYYMRHFAERIIYIYAKIEDILELEKKYDKLTRKIFGETPTEFYKRNVETLGKRFVDKADFEGSRFITDLFENKTSIKKIPHKNIKWRFSFN